MKKTKLFLLTLVLLQFANVSHIKANDFINYCESNNDDKTAKHDNTYHKYEYDDFLDLMYHDYGEL